MARQTHRLSVLGVKRLSKPGLHADGNGLYLSIDQRGAKSWRIIYTRQGKRHELGIGSATAVSLAEARDKAIEARRLIAAGENPKDIWARSKRGNSDRAFGEIATALINDRKAGWKNAKHIQQWENTFSTYAAPIWQTDVAEIGVEDVLDILRPIWTKKPVTANRVRGRIEAVLDAAKVRGLRSGENPATWRGNLALLLSKKPKGPTRHHPAMPYADVPAFLENLGRRTGLAARALELTILTAARTSEALHARWSELDLDQALWIIPACRMKGGREHRIPLSPPAVALLQELPSKGGFVFPGLKKDRPLSNMAMEMVLRRMKTAHFTVHGFRSSFRDWCAEETSVPRELAEQALAHQVGSEVERAYRRGDALEQRRALMSAWASFVEGGRNNCCRPKLIQTAWNTQLSVGLRALEQ